MSDTYQFKLPFMQPSQAQKHVTFNEVAALLDAVAQLRLVSLTTTTPPAGGVDGAAYNVAAGATGDWSGQDGQVAVASNGGWLFVTPKTGWRAWVEDTNTQYFYYGGSWVDDVVATSPAGATMRNRILEFDHDILAGNVQYSITDIPANSLLYGLTGRIVEVIVADASATGWKLGVTGDNPRFGAGHGLALNSYVHSISSSPTAYYSDQALRIACIGGNFISGKIRFCLHLMELSPPDSV